MGILWQLRACDKGTSAVEYAIISPIFILITMSLIAYGIYLSAAHSVQQITADAARTAIAGITEADREQLVANYASQSTISDASIDPTKITATVQADPNDSNQFTVTVAYYAASLPIWNLYTYALLAKPLRDPRPSDW